MHPEIKKFWEDAGYRISDGAGMLFAYKSSPSNPAIARITVVCFGDTYRFNETWYSETEMLRIIKQKAFL